MLSREIRPKRSAPEISEHVDRKVDPPEHVQTKREIEAMLSERGLRPRKRFGQHFLIDGNLMRRLADSAELGGDDLILEVGAGTGGLTDLLHPRSRCVLCVEVDHDLCAILAERFAGVENVTLVRGDILASKHRLAPLVADLLGRDEPRGAGVIKLVANLPYQVATPLVMNLLTGFSGVRRYCFTVQAEVGDRFAAPVGSKHYGPVSVIAQLSCDLTVIARPGPQAFWPRPAVDSVMLRMDVTEPPLASADELRRFAGFVHGVFEHRRKTLRSALGYVVDVGIVERLSASFDLACRPQQVSPEQWCGMFRAASLPGSS